MTRGWALGCDQVHLAVAVEVNFVGRIADLLPRFQLIGNVGIAKAKAAGKPFFLG